MLRATGAGALGALAGCLGGSTDTADGDGDAATPTDTGGDATTDAAPAAPFEHAGTVETSFATNGDFPADDDPADGRPPAFEEPPARPDADPSSFETLPVNDETVRLAPIDVVVDWYRRGDARFVDARGLDQYTTAHVYGAVFSTAQRGSTGGPIPDWPSDERVVTYCGCPHHLSSVRAAGLQKAGFSDVYAINEGFLGRDDSWRAQDYPMAGTSFRSSSQAALAEWTLTGSVDARYAGEFVWASADRQYEAAPVREDGSYELVVRFQDVSADTPVTVTTPARSVTRPLGELSSGPVDGR